MSTGTGPISSRRPSLRRDSRRVSRTFGILSAKPGESPSQAYKPAISFGFHIEGVLMRSWIVLYGAKATLRYLREKQIPFFLFTKTKEETREELSKKFGMEFDYRQVIPLRHLLYDIVAQYANKNILVLGGAGDSIRETARKYGLNKVFTSWDLYKRTQFPDELQISAIFVLDNPRDWKLDSVVAMGLLLSRAGYIGSVSPMNGKNTLPNRGYGQFQQPDVYWCNPESTSSFKGALESIWREETGGADMLRGHTVRGPLPPPKVRVTYDVKYIPGNHSRPGCGVRETVDWALRDSGWLTDDDICNPEGIAGIPMLDSQRGRAVSQRVTNSIAFSEVDLTQLGRCSLPELSGSRRDINESALPLRHPTRKRVHRLSKVEIGELGLGQKRSPASRRADTIPEVSREAPPIPKTKAPDRHRARVLSESPALSASPVLPVTPPNRRTYPIMATHRIEGPRGWETYSSLPSQQSQRSCRSQPSYTPYGSPNRINYSPRPSCSQGNSSEWETTSSELSRTPDGTPNRINYSPHSQGISSRWETTSSSELSHTPWEASRISSDVRTDWGDSVIDLIEDLESDFSFRS